LRMGHDTGPSHPADPVAKTMPMPRPRQARHRQPTSDQILGGVVCIAIASKSKSRTSDDEEREAGQEHAAGPPGGWDSVQRTSPTDDDVALALALALALSRLVFMNVRDNGERGWSKVKFDACPL
jgi:hypothetical protein